MGPRVFVFQTGIMISPGEPLMEGRGRSDGGLIPHRGRLCGQEGIICFNNAVSGDD